ncbi:TRAP transporter substrate-binding protein DctP [Vibrio sp.]|nr:TRAP transporter substrate-binding protein DctP [Vibrio sp.]
MKQLKKAALAISMMLSTSAMAAEFTFQVPHNTHPESYNHQSLLVFKNHVENRSNGRINVTIYPSAQMCGSAKECISGIQAGIFDYFPTTVSEVANYWKGAESFDFPYMLPNDRVAECVYENKTFINDVNKEFTKAAPNVRLMMVANSGGWRNFATAEKQVKSPADLKDLKMRTVPSKIQQDLVKLYEASASPTNFAELYIALQTGVVDGTKNGIVDIVDSKLHETLDYIILDGHSYMAGAWVMSEKKFNSLPLELKKVVLDAVEAQQQYLMSYAKHNEYSAYKTFVKSNGQVYNPSEEEKSAFKDKSSQLIKAWEKTATSEQKQWFNRFKTEINHCTDEVAKEYDAYLGA